MRIALVTDGIFPYVIGGMQKHSYYLCKYLTRLGVEVDLYHTNMSKFDIQKLELFTEEEKSKINSIVINFPQLNKVPGHYLRASYRYSLEIFKVFKNRPPVDFIYCKGFAGWKLAQEKTENRLDIPLAINFHGYEMFQPPPNFRSRIEQYLLFRGPVKYICNAANYVISYGAKIDDVILSIPVSKSKIISIPTGIEESWVNQKIRPTEAVKRFLFIGRYERRKGIQELSAAIEKLKSSNVEFHFIGPIPKEKQLKDTRVKYYGSISNQEEIRSIVQTTDVLVCPSYSEGMPNVIMEAMASGLAVIATNVGAVNLLVGADNGYLMELSELHQLEQILERINNLDALSLDKMKKNSVEKIKQQFLWTNIARIHLDFFQKAIENGHQKNNKYKLNAE